MADLTLKARNLALDMIAAADQLMSAFEKFEAINSEKEGSGIDWDDDDLEAMIAADSQLKHVDKDKLNGAHSNSASIYAAMKAAFQDDVFQALRP